MKIGKPFNQLALEQYIHCIDNHKKYKDFNTLGLYRSLTEHEGLIIEEKLIIREHAHKVFRKTFDFLQLKDPHTYMEVSTLGQTLTNGDEEKIWADIRKNQQSILADKRIRHRNFGIYSKHRCGYEGCHLEGLMVRQGSILADSHMYFESDKNRYLAKDRADRRKSERKKKQQIIDREIAAG